MSRTWTLRDINNRGDDGAPWEATGQPKELVAYLNGPVRSDLAGDTDLADFDALVQAVLGGDLADIQERGPSFGIYVRANQQFVGNDVPDDHQCEEWQMREHTRGGRYCAACGRTEVRSQSHGGDH